MQKINQPFYLIISSNYEHVVCGLFEGQQKKAELTDHKHNISKNLILMLEALLKKNKLSLSDISFIGINQGPGPFTTLRTVIASVNGISFAKQIPLIGINSLIALLQEQKSTGITVALLNAFNNDVYFGIAQNQQYEIGCENIDLFLQNLKSQCADHQINFIGSGSLLYKQKIQEMLGDQAVFPKNVLTHASIDQIAKMAVEKWYKQKEFSYQLLPLYLKEQKFKKIM